MVWGFPSLMLLWGSGQSPALPPPRDPDPEPAPEEEEEEEGEGEGEEEGDRAPIPSIPPQQQGGDWAPVSFPRTNRVSPFFWEGEEAGRWVALTLCPLHPCGASAAAAVNQRRPGVNQRSQPPCGIKQLLQAAFGGCLSRVLLPPAPAARSPRGHGLGHPNKPPRTTRLLGSCRLVVI